MKPKPAVVENIKNIRNQLGWTQAKLARESGLTSAAISLLEKGERTPLCSTIQKIAMACNVSVAVLLELPCSKDVAHDKDVFFMTYGKIERLCDEDKKLVLRLVNRLLKGNA